MKCDHVQPNLLDYGKDKLSRSESEEIRAHLKECAECAALLEEEIAFSGRLSSLPVEEHHSDVWALIRSQTKPKRFNPTVWLNGVFSTGYKKATAALFALAVILMMLYTFNPVTEKPSELPSTTHSSVVQVKWSDDPLGNQTDAVIEYIGDM